MHARPGADCFACGQHNPNGLRITFHQTGNGEMAAEWTPLAAREGFRGMINGGVVSTVLDEAMSKAVTAAGIEALTAELRMRFRRHVVPGKSLRLRGWIVPGTVVWGRTEATLMGDGETEYPRAWASFLVMRGRAGRPGNSSVSMTGAEDPKRESH